VRSLLVSGGAMPADIALAAASTAEYDDFFLALRDDANIDLHFVNGIKITSTRDGQTAAALADIVIRGLSQSRLRRLASLCASDDGPFSKLPKGWMRVLPADAPLGSLSDWMTLLDRLTSADWPDAVDHAPSLRAIVELLVKGHEAAQEIGTGLLNGRALEIWRKALLAGPVGSLDVTLEGMKQDDGLDACVSVAWMSAAALAASPRRFVRLLGLNSSHWPRAISEDCLISDHLISTAELDPLPIDAADRRDFETILATTGSTVVMSRSRRDGDGRLLGRSSMPGSRGDEEYVRRNAIPIHAYSETDRMMARPREFARDPQAKSALACWHDWHRKEITPHDGLVRADHPLVLAALDRTQSASSLRLLLRNPLGFVWRYAMQLRVPQSGTDVLILGPLEMGNLVHMTLDLSLRKLQASGGSVGADAARISAATEAAAAEIATVWEIENPVPPALIWRRTLDDARVLAEGALAFDDTLQPGTQSYSEVAFGGATPKSPDTPPWDTEAVVEIPDCGFRVSGYIDRIDISRDGRHALVRDYKTGSPPKEDDGIDGGRELQRALYGFAVKALLGADVSISASLLFPREGLDLRLADPDAALAETTRFLGAARASLAAGNGLIGPDAGGSYDGLAFALPANAGATYCKRKTPAVFEHIGEAAEVWEAR
jgi:hypothetical protein